MKIKKMALLTFLQSLKYLVSQMIARFSFVFLGFVCSDDVVPSHGDAPLSTIFKGNNYGDDGGGNSGITSSQGSWKGHKEARFCQLSLCQPVTAKWFAFIFQFSC